MAAEKLTTKLIELPRKLSELLPEPYSELSFRGLYTLRSAHMHVYYKAFASKASRHFVARILLEHRSVLLVTNPFYFLFFLCYTPTQAHSGADPGRGGGGIGACMLHCCGWGVWPLQIRS